MKIFQLSLLALVLSNVQAVIVPYAEQIKDSKRAEFLDTWLVFDHLGSKYTIQFKSLLKDSENNCLDLFGMRNPPKSISFTKLMHEYELKHVESGRKRTLLEILQNPNINQNNYLKITNKEYKITYDEKYNISNYQVEMIQEIIQYFDKKESEEKSKAYETSRTLTASFEAAQKQGIDVQKRIALQRSIAIADATASEQCMAISDSIEKQKRKAITECLLREFDPSTLGITSKHKDFAVWEKQRKNSYQSMTLATAKEMLLHVTIKVRVQDKNGNQTYVELNGDQILEKIKQHRACKNAGSFEVKDYHFFDITDLQNAALHNFSWENFATQPLFVDDEADDKTPISLIQMLEDPKINYINYFNSTNFRIEHVKGQFGKNDNTFIFHDTVQQNVRHEDAELFKMIYMNYLLYIEKINDIKKSYNKQSVNPHFLQLMALPFTNYAKKHLRYLDENQRYWEDLRRSQQGPHSTAEMIQDAKAIVAQAEREIRVF